MKPEESVSPEPCAPPGFAFSGFTDSEFGLTNEKLANGFGGFDVSFFSSLLAFSVAAKTGGLLKVNPPKFRPEVFTVEDGVDSTESELPPETLNFDGAKLTADASVVDLLANEVLFTSDCAEDVLNGGKIGVLVPGASFDAENADPKTGVCTADALDFAAVNEDNTGAGSTPTPSACDTEAAGTGDENLNAPDDAEVEAEEDAKLTDEFGNADNSPNFATDEKENPPNPLPTELGCSVAENIGFPGGKAEAEVAEPKSGSDGFAC